MGIKFDVDSSGLNKLLKKIDKIPKEQTVPLKDILTDKFVSSNSLFKNLDEFMTTCGIHTTEEFENFPDAEMDKFVRSNTNFSSWKEMIGSAGAEYYKNQLDL